ncbi:hypothetical protein J7M28_05455 [bacterium]|nr:hypothetical protein [bacterium]
MAKGLFRIPRFTGLLRGGAYKFGRLLGDFQALSSGSPKRVGKRVGRRIVGKATGKGLRKLFKD